ncbi:MAG TPA: 50S ribosomal protein L13 [Armatimonadota bacterium]|jgi:large subunit ribosomal protein L13
MKTYVAKAKEIEHKWYVVDATGKSVGRMAASVAAILRGKHKPTFSPNADCGDHVIIVNAEKVVLKGPSKAEEPIYWHTGWPGGLKQTTRGKLLETRPQRYVEKVVKGMLPHNSLGAVMFTKLKVYAGPEHPHAAQHPEPLEL